MAEMLSANHTRNKSIALNVILTALGEENIGLIK